MGDVCVNIMGGLGNQLFQIASAYSYARKNNGNLRIPKIRKDQNGGYRKVYWNSLLKKVQPYLVENMVIENIGKEIWREDYPTMYKEISPLTNNKYLSGYFQTSKYFGDDIIKKEIKELFKPDDCMFDIVRDLYGDILEVKDRIVVLHCRRTDYLNFPDFHNPLNSEYYKKAINSMLKKVSNPFFLLCGDDNNFWEEIRKDIPEVYSADYFILNENDILSFVLLQQFDNFIMSNSTFIWWCVWLSNQKNVIAPDKWFGPSGPKLYRDIYESNWEII